MMILCVGGAASGKSAWAESFCLSLPGPWYYLATMQQDGAESRARIKRHRALRAGKGFLTLERERDLAGLCIPKTGTVLLECVGNLTANEMFSGPIFPSDPFPPVIQGIKALAAQGHHLVLVSYEVGGDGGGYDEMTMAYVRALGKINCALAEEADTVVEVVCGFPLLRKGCLSKKGGLCP